MNRRKGEFTKAWEDLDEAWEIAEYKRMRLLLTDYHLESARLIRAMLEAGDSEFVIVDEGLERQVSADEMKMVYRKHIQAADELIKATGYHRRDDEVEELRSAIND